MAVQKPLVIVNGITQQLPLNDLVVGAVVCQLPISGSNFSVAIDSSALSTTNFTGGQLRATPFYIQTPVTVINNRVEVTTLGAASLFRLGIYTDNGSAYPGTLVGLSDIGTIDSSTIGVKLSTYVSAITLQPGLYWQVSNANLSTPFLRVIGAGSLRPILGFPVALGAGSQTGALVASFAFAAMPGTFPAGATDSPNASAVCCLYGVQ